MRHLARLAPLLVGAVPLAACQPGHPAAGLPQARHAVAMLTGAGGRPAGRVTVTEVTGGLRIAIDASGLAPGPHGAHLHTVGRCDLPGFLTAGPHWNPGGAQHGSMNPRGPHAGDLPNLIVGPDGRGTLGVVLAGASYDALLDADGAALVIHAGQDDLATDPSGNSGARVACGVLATGQTPA